VKIAEIEKRIRQGDCSEKMLEMFKASLKRVPKVGRCQHCYTTAVAMPSRFHSQAISLIQFGLDQYSDSWIDRMRSYENIAIILETQGDYVGAKQAYGKALSSVDPNLRLDYEPEFAAHLMRTEMHINDFDYTDDLEKHYNIAMCDDEFSQAFQKKRFYCLLAEIIIFTRNNDLTRAHTSYLESKKMLRPGFVGPLTYLLKKNGYIDSTGVTKKARRFLRRAGKHF